MCVSFRHGRYKPDDGPVHGLIMHPRESFGNVTKRVTRLFEVKLLTKEKSLSMGKPNPHTEVWGQYTERSWIGEE